MRTASLGTRAAALLFLAVSAWGRTYYIAASGNDTANGTSKTTPWAHAPGMTGCSSTCNSTTPAAGDQIIFKGGDTWHFNGSSTPPAAWWEFDWSGSSGNNIYIGVDQTWYTGSSWTRPIFNGDNPLTPNPGVFGDYVASCSAQAGTYNNFLRTSGATWITIDNFEWTGLCNDTNNALFAHDGYIEILGSGNTLVEHNYFHGWTHFQFSCSGEAVGACVNAHVMVGQTANGDAFKYNVIDGSDSDPGGLIDFDPGSGQYDTSYNVFNNTSDTEGSLCHLFHDNLVQNMYDLSDGNAHGNVWECVSNNNMSAVNAFYNNVIRNISPGGSPGVVNLWPEPEPTTVAHYFFNNVLYNISGGGGNYFDIGQNDRDQGTIVAFNNTFVQSYAAPIYSCATAGFAEPLTRANNHYIIDGSSPYGSACPSSPSPVTDLTQGSSTAAGQGYTSSETYAYSPANAMGSTVGAGTNESSMCSALSTAAKSDATLNNAASACLSDTTYGVAYNASNHTVGSAARTPVLRPVNGAWDIGSFQYSAAQGSQPNPPTGLTATSQ